MKPFDPLYLRNALLSRNLLDVNRVTFLNSLLNSVEYRLKRMYLTSNPELVQIEPTTACNLQCIMCGRRGKWHSLNQHPFHMSKATFLRLVPFLKTAQRVFLHGFGESLLHPEIDWMVRTAKAHGAQVSLLTNGIELHRHSRELVLAGLDYLNISIDAATSETYQSIRRGNFDQLIGNLESMRRFKEQTGRIRPRLHLSYILMRRNLHELQDLVALAHRLDVKWIKLNHLVAWEDVPGLREESVFGMEDEVERFVSIAIQQAREKGILMTFPGMAPKIQSMPCPWKHFAVMADGSAGACGAHKFNFDNVNQKPLRDIWNGEDYRELRRGFRDGALPYRCEHCYGRTNAVEDWIHPDTSYVEETLALRKHTE